MQVMGVRRHQVNPTSMARDRLRRQRLERALIYRQPSR
jgi:hypothetical protein